MGTDPPLRRRRTPRGATPAGLCMVPNSSQETVPVTGSPALSMMVALFRLQATGNPAGKWRCGTLEGQDHRKCERARIGSPALSMMSGRSPGPNHRVSRGKWHRGAGSRIRIIESAGEPRYRLEGTPLLSSAGFLVEDNRFYLQPTSTEMRGRGPGIFRTAYPNSPETGSPRPGALVA
jgi:hypothetical protein